MYDFFRNAQKSSPDILFYFSRTQGITYQKKRRKTDGRFYAFSARLYCQMIKYTLNAIKCLESTLECVLRAMQVYCSSAYRYPPPREAADTPHNPFSKFFIFYFLFFSMSVTLCIRCRVIFRHCHCQCVCFVFVLVGGGAADGRTEIIKHGV